MLRRMPGRLLIEWSLFAELEPFGEERADLRTSALMQTLVNLHRDPKRNPRPFPLGDFLLRIGDAGLPPAPTRTQTAKQQFDILKMIALAHAPQRARRAGPR